MISHFLYVQGYLLAVPKNSRWAHRRQNQTKLLFLTPVPHLVGLMWDPDLLQLDDPLN